ncbi:MAG: flagellar basal body L-ring protein FlgH [Spirochaetota bacterium]|nr:flagellar basal body L-ring protein FlgH [Spirochaetota bacterium]
MKLYKLIAIIGASLFLSTSLISKSLWRDKNIYSSADDLRIGDIIVVEIDDISKLTFTVALNNQNSFSITSLPDENITGFLPKVSSDKKIERNDNTKFSGMSNMRIPIASRITGRLEDGKYQIAGIREYSFRGITNRFGISGVIDPAFVIGRSVKSRSIANFQLNISSYTTGAGIKVERPGPEEGESADIGLTEGEKQKIIVDYLERMLNELSR